MACMRYLLAIYRLKKQAPLVREVDIARVLHVTKPSVSRFIGRLVTKGMIEKRLAGNLCLTSQGLRIAQQISAKQQTVKKFLDLTIDADFEYSAAEILEITYAVSDRIYEEFLNYCTTVLYNNTLLPAVP